MPIGLRGSRIWYSQKCVVGNGLGRCSIFMFFFLAGAIVLDLWLKRGKIFFFPGSLEK